MPEMIDVYDSFRRPTGRTAPRGELGPGEYRLIAHVCVFSCNRMLIQLRSPEERTMGGLWDLSAGGQVDAGERSEQGAARELKEELGIDRVLFPGNRMATVRSDGCFDDYYGIEYDEEEIVLQKNEVSDWRWASLEEIIRMTEAGMFLQYGEDFIRSLFELHADGGFLSTVGGSAYSGMDCHGL